jgi:hypothetical protein
MPTTPPRAAWATPASSPQPAGGGSAKWNPSVHPRTRGGLFAESGGSVDVYASTTSKQRTGTGVVVGNTADGKLVVEIKAGANAGQRVTVDPSAVGPAASLKAKAHLPHPGGSPRAPGAANPTAARPTSATTAYAAGRKAAHADFTAKRADARASRDKARKSAMATAEAAKRAAFADYLKAAAADSSDPVAADRAAFAAYSHVARQADQTRARADRAATNTYVAATGALATAYKGESATARTAHRTAVDKAKAERAAVASKRKAAAAKKKTLRARAKTVRAAKTAHSKTATPAIAEWAKPVPPATPGGH